LVLIVMRVFSFSSFCKAYFSRWRSRHRRHFVARPLSPNAAHGRKFLQPLHHLISVPVVTTTQTLTSHKVQRPLFCVGMMAYPLLSPMRSCPLLLLGARPCSPPPCLPVHFFVLFPDEHWQALPHMTQQRMPSGRLPVCFWDMWAGKLTKLVNSGTSDLDAFSMSPWNLDGIGGFKGTHFLLDCAMLFNGDPMWCGLPIGGGMPG
jgi:hypothetical protein